MSGTSVERVTGVHLTDEEAFDLLEGLLPQARAEHVWQCSGCRALVEELRATIAIVQEVDVPEPSPLFWEDLSARVSEFVGRLPREGEELAPERERGAMRRGAPSWWRAWRFAAPCAAAVAALVVATAVTRPPRIGSGGAGASEREATPVAAGSDLFEALSADTADALDLVASMVTESDVDPADVSGAAEVFVAGDAVERALPELSEDEQRDLIVALRRELGGRGA